MEKTSISELYERADKIGSCVCGFQLQAFSITGTDYDSFLHGSVYGTILRESSIVRLWSPPSAFKESPAFGDFHKVAPNCYESEIASARSIGEFVQLINMSYRDMSPSRRVSLAFALPSHSTDLLATIVAKAGLFGPMSSVSQVMKGHGKSPWSWARQMSREDSSVILSSSQTGPKYFELFPSFADSKGFIDRLGKLNPEFLQYYSTEDY